ncbi:MAG: large-conductance mechanosensitive channel protein MscL [Verrucomicrobiota bacterium]
MSVMSEFKAFVLRGNVIDLAVGVIIGAAFGKIVSSMVDNLLNPVLGLFLGKVDMKGLYLALDGKAYSTLEEAEKVKAPLLKYGLFLQNILDFVIMAFVIFLLIRLVNKLFLKPAPAAPVPPPEPSKEEKLLAEIRDILKSAQITPPDTRTSIVGIRNTGP